ncbi:putative Transcription factor domain-containing protein [Seiridium cardinale]|uniref:Transcription factor domain-containing protein n=1 Tax=Seiridium cardinale TaxID=138064 RepID=A0ABR2XVS6_9PEZI
MPCVNSILLTPHDRFSLDYFLMLTVCYMHLGSLKSGVDYGLYHYAAALQDLQRCIKPGHAADGKDNLDAIFSTMFLMIHYGLRPSSSVGDAKAQFAGLKSLVTAYFRSLHRADSMMSTNDLSPLASQLIVWSMYVFLYLSGHTKASPIEHNL